MTALSSQQILVFFFSSVIQPFLRLFKSISYSTSMVSLFSTLVISFTLLLMSTNMPKFCLNNKLINYYFQKIQVFLESQISVVEFGMRFGLVLCFANRFFTRFNMVCAVTLTENAFPSHHLFLKIFIIFSYFFIFNNYVFKVLWFFYYF